MHATAARDRSVGIIAGLLASVAFATSGPVIKPLMAAGWSPGSAILVRLSVGALLLAGPAAWALRGRWHVLRDEWRSVVGFGVLGVAGAATMFYLAVDRLPVAVALLVEYTGPLLLVAWRWLRTREAPSRAVLAGAALATGGLVLVLDVTGQLDLDPLGLAFALVSAVGNAAYFAFVGRRSELPSISLAGAGMVVGAATVALVAAVGVLPLAAPDVRVALLGAHVHWIVPLLVVATLPTAIAYGVSALSARLLGERLASFLALTEVLFAVLLAWALLGEAPLPLQLLGMVLVVAGIALVRRGTEEPEAPHRELESVGDRPSEVREDAPVGVASPA